MLQLKQAVRTISFQRWSQTLLFLWRGWNVKMEGVKITQESQEQDSTPRTDINDICYVKMQPDTGFPSEMEQSHILCYVWVFLLFVLFWSSQQHEKHSTVDCTVTRSGLWEFVFSYLLRISFPSVPFGYSNFDEAVYYLGGGRHSSPGLGFFKGVGHSFHASFPSACTLWHQQVCGQK